MVNKLKDVTSEYRAFGLQLGIKDDKIKEIQLSNCDVQRCLTDMLTEWYRSYEVGNRAVAVLGAIESESINNIALANKLREKWG